MIKVFPGGVKPELLSGSLTLSADRGLLNLLALTGPLSVKSLHLVIYH